MGRTASTEPQCLYKGAIFPLLFTKLSTSGVDTQPHYIKMFLRVFFRVRRPISTLDWVLLKDSNRAFKVGLGSEIKFGARLFIHSFMSSGVSKKNPDRKCKENIQ